MNIQSPILNVLNKTIRISGKKMIRDFSEIEKLQSSVKNTEKFIEITKLNILNDLKEVLGKLRPNLKIRSINNELEDCWIIDPIDSITNFSRAIDNFVISISLKEDNKINACVLYNPIRDENFYFQIGFGGFKNDYRIRVSEKKKLKDSISSFFFKNLKIENRKILGNIRQIMQNDNNIEIRESGSILHDISLLSSGKIDCLLFSDSSLRINEQISFIISETGGVFLELEINEKKIYVASNKYIGKIIKEMIENKYENH